MHKTNPTKVIKEKDQNIFSLTPATESCDAVQTGLNFMSLPLQYWDHRCVHHAWLEGLNYIIVIWKFPSDEINSSPKKKSKCPSRFLKVFITPSHRGNANVDYFEVALHPSQNGYHPEI